MSQVSVISPTERLHWRGKMNAALIRRGLMSPKRGVCSVCGCTDKNCRNCVRRTGVPCQWVNDDHTLCSACI